MFFGLERFSLVLSTFQVIPANRMCRRNGSLAVGTRSSCVLFLFLKCLQNDREKVDLGWTDEI